MNYPYRICDDTGETLLACQELIECHDFSRTGDTYLFALVSLSNQYVDFLLHDKVYTLKCADFDTRLDFDFSVKKIIKSSGVVYLSVVVMNGMYKVGVLSLLKNGSVDGDERIWLDMVMGAKIIYISASYVVGGVRHNIEKDTIVIEGKYIHDYYSFYCEFGYSFFGKFGYMGNNLDAFDDCVAEIERENTQINVIWKDSDLSLKAIDNTIPSEVYPLSSHDIVEILNAHCNLILE